MVWVWCKISYPSAKGGAIWILANFTVGIFFSFSLTNKILENLFTWIDKDLNVYSIVCPFQVKGGDPLLQLIAVDWFKVENCVSKVALHPSSLVQVKDVIHLSLNCETLEK